MPDETRPTGEAAMRRPEDRRAALERLVEVADFITSELVVGERASEHGKYVVGALTLLNWRDRITSAVKILEARDAR